MASGGSLHMEDLLQFLESADTITDIKEIILENLKSSKAILIYSLYLKHN